MQAGPEPKPEPEPERESDEELHSPATLTDSDPVPQPGDPYKAHARPSTKPVAALHVVKGKLSNGYAWSNFDSVDLVESEDPGGGLGLVLRFAGLKPTEILLAGRNLATLRVYLGENRIAWIRELPQGMMLRDTGQAVITGIEIRVLEK
jgi:hypothetical protein